MEDTNDPVWNEPFDIFVPVGNSLYLQIMIMDKDPAASTDFIGRSVLPVTTVIGLIKFKISREPPAACLDTCSHHIRVNVTFPFREIVCPLEGFRLNSVAYLQCSCVASGPFIRPRAVARRRPG